MVLTEKGQNNYKLVCFCDASGMAYATVIYLHQSSNNITWRADLIFSKIHLVPSETTMPITSFNAKQSHDVEAEVG